MKCFIFKLVLLMAAFLVSCGGGSDITETLTPGVSFDEQVYQIPAFQPTDSDSNGITGSAVVNSVDFEEGQTPTVTVPVGTSYLQVSFTVIGHGFVTNDENQNPARADVPITDLKDEVGDDENLCTAVTAVAGLEDLTSDLSVVREQAESIRVESLREEEDITVPFTITLSANPGVAKQITGRRLGIREIPAELLVEITRQRGNGIYGFLAGLAIRAVLGPIFNSIGIVDEVVEVTCGDPTVTLHGNMLLKGHGVTSVPDPDPDPELNLPPTARLTASPSSGELNFGELYVTLNASQSSDPEDLPLQYQFSFGDGTEATDWQENSSILHYYTEAGTFTASVNIQDSVGWLDSATTTIVVTQPQPPANQSPVAEMALIPTSGDAPLTVTLDGSASYDIDGTIIRHTWNIQGDDDQSGITSSYTFTEPGIYSVVLEVEDDDGATDRTEDSVITVVDPAEPELDWYLVEYEIESTYAVGDSHVFADIEAVVVGGHIGFVLWEPYSGPVGTFTDPQGDIHPRLDCELWVPVEGMTGTVETTVKVTPFENEVSHDAGDPPIGESLWFTLRLSPG